MATVEATAAQPPAQPRVAASATVQTPPFKLAYVPRDSLLVYATRPAALFQREALAPLRESLVQLGGASLRIDLSPEDVSEFTLVLLPGLDQGPPIAVILRASSDAAARKFVSSLGPGAQPRDFAGQNYFRLASRACYFQPDAQTVVFSPDEPTLVRCLAAARTGNSRTRSLNNLKMIALAFHNYHDTYKRFPAAIQLGPKSTPRSWRVTLLPFLDQGDLYQQYRQDEPWDSAHNQQLAARMPEVFRHPADDPSSANASYFALVGPDTVFPDNQAIGIGAITDGTSNTLLVVETKQETPWTKPEDIPFDSQQPLPKLGGWSSQGFCAALCDGSARFFAQDTLDERMLRFIIMRSDGNAVRWPP